MSHQKGAYLGGVCDLDSLKARCNVCEDSGCWRWKLSLDQGGAKVWLRAADGSGMIMRGRRVALILAGRPAKPGQFVFGNSECVWAECVNPDHCIAGTRKQSINAAVARGAFDTPARMRAMVAFRKMQQRLSDDALAEIAASDESSTVLAARHGVSRSRICAIRSKGVGGRRRAASVFEWRGVA